jgi:hypothetical protein
VALITCRNLPEPDPDQEPLLDALRQAGLRAEMLAWDDPEADPAAFDLCRLHSCWDYYRNPALFLDWIERGARVTRLVNPASAVRWNLHKSYLRRLGDAGVPIIPTEWIARGERVDLHDTMLSNEWNEVVVKPAISASSFSTRRFRIDQVVVAQAFLDTLIESRDMMVQHYMPSVETAGERSLVWIDGEFTHAVRKMPRFADGIQQTSDATPVATHERRVGEQALDCVDSELLYARVDLIEDDDGNPLVSELELMEPSLFLLECPAALERLVNGIVRICSGPQP